MDLVKATLDASIVVEGNKMTIKMSEEVSTLKDVVLYAFQDADCSQLHFYMRIRLLDDPPRDGGEDRLQSSFPEGLLDGLGT